MSEILELVMIVAFGFSWPINVIKAYKARSTRGTSILFLFLIFFGYIAGILSKFLNPIYMESFNKKWYVLIFYFINLIMVSLAIIVYYRNKMIEKKEMLSD